MEERSSLFEEELVENRVASALKYFSSKGYGLRPRKRVAIAQKSNVSLVEFESEDINNANVKERYKELARVFHGSKPAKKNSIKSAKRLKLSFEVPVAKQLKMHSGSKPKARLFGFK